MSRNALGSAVSSVYYHAMGSAVSFAVAHGNPLTLSSEVVESLGAKEIMNSAELTRMLTRKRAGKGSVTICDHFLYQPIALSDDICNVNEVTYKLYCLIDMDQM